MTTATDTRTIGDVLAEHEFVPPCDLRRDCPLHGYDAHPCPRPAAWVVTFADCPSRCGRSTMPALWCDDHMTAVLQPDATVDCAVCGHVFKPASTGIATQQPLGGIHD